MKQKDTLAFLIRNGDPVASETKLSMPSKAFFFKDKNGKQGVILLAGPKEIPEVREIILKF